MREADNPHHLHVPNVMEIWETKPPGTLWDTLGLLRETFTFTFISCEKCEFGKSFLIVLYITNMYLELHLNARIFIRLHQILME